MTDKEFRRIVTHMHRNYGIDLREKRVIIEGRMSNYLHQCGYQSYDEFMDYVEKAPAGPQAQRLVDILTTNHTYFLREPEHFDFLRNEILPEWKEKEKYSRQLRIWCAAASSGEEPYTIAMVLKDFFGVDYVRWDTTLLATDVSKKVLLQAIQGVYTKDHLKGIPGRWLSNNFKKLSEDQYQVRDELKKNVLFRQFNLMDVFPFHHKMHVVFLRNVMIYFDDATKKELVNKICDYLEPGGYLIIGTTESIEKGAFPLKYVGTSIYRRI